MIFVTVGSIQFDELVRQIDDAVARGDITQKVIMQIGNSRYKPVNCEYFHTTPGLDPYYVQAELVIGHGGTGTTLEVLERGLRLISVSNPSMIDNHQNEFLDALDHRGFIHYCRRLSELPQLIQAYLRNSPPPPVDTTCFFQQVVDDLEALE